MHLPRALTVALLLSAPGFAQTINTLAESFFPPLTGTQASMKEGNGVAVDGNLVAVGAPDDDQGASNAGSVRVYDRATGALLHMILSPAPKIQG